MHLLVAQARKVIAQKVLTSGDILVAAQMFAQVVWRVVRASGGRGLADCVNLSELLYSSLLLLLHSLLL
jgi:hypothetical protein